MAKLKSMLSLDDNIPGKSCSFRCVHLKTYQYVSFVKLVKHLPSAFRHYEWTSNCPPFPVILVCDKAYTACSLHNSRITGSIKLIVYM